MGKRKGDKWKFTEKDVNKEDIDELGYWVI